MIRILIIEDEAPAYRRLDNLLRNQDLDFEIADVIDSISDSVKWLNNHSTPDLIFSDIQLSDGLSFEIYKQVEVHCPIIFTTAFDEYMLNAFQTNGIDYLLKPIQEEELKRSLEKFKRFRLQENADSGKQVEKLLEVLESGESRFRNRFLVRLGDRLIPVKTEAVAYFCYKDGATEMIQSSGKRYVIDQPLDELEKQLNPNKFFRLNRQFLASEESIGLIHRYFKGKLKVELSPEADDEVIVSREKAAKFKIWMDGQVL
ncbi:LytTR family DNA-binding domain-containing protein [Cryomorphaceae bacterium 1068]|nr:LytTR family DNA-binding domain-containing protein [Cryomorphaceae bacterium 1068]